MILEEEVEGVLERLQLPAEAFSECEIECMSGHSYTVKWFRRSFICWKVCCRSTG